MKYVKGERTLRLTATLAMGVASLACSATASDPNDDAGGSSGVGGQGAPGIAGNGGSIVGTGGTGAVSASGGNTAASGNSAGSSTNTGGGHVVGGGGSGGNAPMGQGGSTAPSGSGGAAVGGSGNAGMGGGAGGSSGGSPGVSSKEDDGADCTVLSLPAPGSQPANPKLPDPFKKLDGTRMSTKAEWRCRREELRRMAEKYAYGTKPEKPESVTGTVSKSSISVTVMDNGKSSSFTASITLPSGGKAPYPAIIVYGSAGFGAPLDSTVINSEGVALITYDPYSVGKEGTGRANKQGAFYTIAGSNSTTGLLVAWGWGVSRLIDVIAQSDGTVLKADAIGVTGCSRFGKGAFIAGVFDQRVALTMPIESGSAGVPIWRGIPGEGAQGLSSAYGEQPWFGDAFSSFTSDPTKAPLDTHEVVAMVAPRGLFIMENPHIANLGPKSGHVAALAGAEVYKALGAGDSITYYSDVQSGTHCSMRPEWSSPLRSNIRRFLNHTGNDPGVIKASSSATGNLSSWVDWSAPTLN
jgi:hypothetical protein